MQAKKRNLKGEELGDVQLTSAIAEAVANPQLIKDAIVSLRANARQWSANTKGRTEVNHTGKKPHRQKGTGNARQGCLAAPQFKGGGVVFGPKPKFNQRVRMNRKEKMQSMRAILRQKFEEQKVHIITDEEIHALEFPKTKTFASYLKNFGLFGRKVVFVSKVNRQVFSVDEFELEMDLGNDESTVNFKKSVQNIPGAYFTVVSNLNSYDLLVAHAVIYTESAFQQQLEQLEPNK